MVDLAVFPRLPEFGEWHEDEPKSKMTTYSTDFEKLRVTLRERRESQARGTVDLEEVEYLQTRSRSAAAGDCTQTPGPTGTDDSSSNACSSNSNAKSANLGKGPVAPEARTFGTQSQASRASFEGSTDEETALDGVPLAPFLEAVRKAHTRDKLPSLPRRRFRKDFEQAVLLQAASTFQAADFAILKSTAENDCHGRDGPQKTTIGAEGRGMSPPLGAEPRSKDRNVTGEVRRPLDEEEGDKTEESGEDLLSVSESDDEFDARGIWMELEASVLEDESHIIFMEAAKKAHVRDRMGKLSVKRYMHSGNFKEWAGQLLVA